MTKTKQAKSSNSGGLKKARKVIVLIFGGVVLLAGFAMLCCPAPQLSSSRPGFAILATEFGWARRSCQATLKFLRRAKKKESIKRFLHENSLSLTLFLLFGIFLGGQILTGHRDYNSDRELAGKSRLPLLPISLVVIASKPHLKTGRANFYKCGRSCG